MVSTLYRPDNTQTSLTTQYMSKGLYKIQYTIPTNAPTGTYTLMVEASYQTNAIDLKGANLRSFVLSSTLTQWNAWLLTIQQDTATIKTAIGLIKLNITEISPNITAINGNIATIETDVGTIQTDVRAIDTESIPSIADTQRSQVTILYVNLILSALAAAGVLGALDLLLRKREQT